MDIKLLEDFVCLAAQESFTAAARERNVTQSALSRRVQSLERWLGTGLINRDSKTFALTPQGRIFDDSRVAWSCSDDLPVYSEYPPEP